MSRGLLLCAVILLAGVAALVEAQFYFGNCGVALFVPNNGSSSTTLVYNLSSVNGLVAVGTINNTKYSFNICGSYQQCGREYGVGLCVTDAYGNATPRGTYAYALASYDGSGVSLQYTNYSIMLQTTVVLRCDPYVSAYIIDKVDKSYTNFTIYVRTSVSCPSILVNPTPTYNWSTPTYNWSTTPYNYSTPSYVSPCPYTSDCYSCLATPSCAYCIDSGTCTDANYPTCSNYWKKSSYCAKLRSCTRYNDCGSCAMNYMDGCFWCPIQYSGMNGTCLSEGSYCDDGHITNPQYCNLK